MTKRHKLKCEPHFFKSIVDGIKTFEIRYNDRNFTVGDELQLDEWIPESNTFTGRHIIKKILYITEFAQQPNWVVMSLSFYGIPLEEAELIEISAMLVRYSHFVRLESAKVTEMFGGITGILSSEVSKVLIEEIKKCEYYASIIFSMTNKNERKIEIVVNDDNRYEVKITTPKSVG